MAAFPAPVSTVLTVNSFEAPVDIKQELTLRVLGSGREHLVPGKTVKMIGRRLIVQVSERVEPGTCIRIDCADAFVLGETLGCWSEGGSIFIAAELMQALTGLQQFASLREDSWGQPRRLEIQLRQSA